MHACVLELLKLSSNVNECKPLINGFYIALSLAIGGGASVGLCRLTLWDPS
jgi:hypothetical protein